MAGRFPLYTDADVNGPVVQALVDRGWDVVRAIDALAQQLPCGRPRAALHAASAALNFEGALQAGGSGLAGATTAQTGVGAALGFGSALVFSGFAGTGVAQAVFHFEQAQYNWGGCR